MGEVLERLDELPAGVSLAAAVDGLDRSAVSGGDLVTVLQARWRLLSWLHGELLADLAELVSRQPDGPWQLDPGELWDLAEAEVRAALGLTGRAAQGWLDTAQALVGRLPAVQAALLAGRVDLPRARVLADGVVGLPEPAARVVVEEMLPAAGTLTTGQLRERLRRAVIAVDPAAAVGRQRAAVAGRRVFGELLASGAAVLSGQDLPPDRAAAAWAKVDAIAKGMKRAGDGRGLDALRADTFLDLLTGVPAGVVQPAAAATPAADPVDPVPPTWRTTADRPNATGSGATSGPVDAPAAASAAAGPAAASAGGAGCGCRPGAGPARGGLVEVTVPLATLLHLAEYPGEIPGWGPILADTARTIAHAQAESSPWRLTVYHDTTGHLVHTGPIRRHPGKAMARYVKARDRRCTFPGCRTPARACDLDHLRDWANGGPTTPANLAVKCRRHHRLKDHGWTSRLAPGVWAWHSPHQRLYLNHTDPIGPPG